MKKLKVLAGEILKSSTNEKFCLLTITPQLYSLGEEIENRQRIIRGGKQFLINWSMSFSNELCDLIIHSEEFTRGLIVIVFSTEINDVFEAMDVLCNDDIDAFCNKNIKILTLAGDGRVLFLTHASNHILESIAGYTNSARPGLQ